MEGFGWFRILSADHNQQKTQYGERVTGALRQLINPPRRYFLLVDDRPNVFREPCHENGLLSELCSGLSILVVFGPVRELLDGCFDLKRSPRGHLRGPRKAKPSSCRQTKTDFLPLLSLTRSPPLVKLIVPVAPYLNTALRCRLRGKAAAT
jgi:hypothetical protein